MATKGPFYDEEFVKICDLCMARLKINKSKLAGALRIEKEYFSKLYNGKQSIPSHIRERIKALAEGSTAATQPGQGGNDEMQEVKAILHRIEASHEVLVQLVIAMAVGKAGKMPAYVKQIIQGKKDPGATGTHG